MTCGLEAFPHSSQFKPFRSVITMKSMPSLRLSNGAGQPVTPRLWKDVWYGWLLADLLFCAWLQSFNAADKPAMSPSPRRDTMVATRKRKGPRRTTAGGAGLPVAILRNCRMRPAWKPSSRSAASRRQRKAKPSRRNTNLWTGRSPERSSHVRALISSWLQLRQASLAHFIFIS